MSVGVMLTVLGIGLGFYLGIGVLVSLLFDMCLWDDDIRVAVIVLWPVVLVAGFVLIVLGLLRSVVVGCIKLVREVFG